MRLLQSEVGQVKNEIRRTTHVLACMLHDKNTWSRNLKNHHSVVFLPSSGTESLHHNTSHHISLHNITCIYIYTCIVFEFWQDVDIPSYALRIKSQEFNFYFLPSRIRIGSSSTSIRSTSSPK